MAISKKIATGVYEAVNNEGTVFTLVKWNSYTGEGSKKWNVYQCSFDGFADRGDDDWCTTVYTKKEAIEWVND